MSVTSSINSIEQVNTNITNKTSKSNTASGQFSSYMEETKTLDDIFEEAADKYNVPVELLKAVGKAESGFDTNAVSRCGAQGVMQLMPKTAESLGVTDSFDPEQNIMGGAKYLKELLERYDGDTKLALAAYNAGSGNVAKYGGIPPFEETQNYVVKVMKYMKEGTDTGNKTVTTASTKQVTTYVSAPKNDYEVISLEEQYSQLDSLFSYDDYMKFLDFFEYTEDREEDATNKYLNSINYSAPVVNLLNQGTKII